MLLEGHFWDDVIRTLPPYPKFIIYKVIEELKVHKNLEEDLILEYDDFKRDYSSRGSI